GAAYNYRGVARRYLRYLREHHFDAADYRRIQKDEMHPSRALNELVLNDPFERMKGFLQSLPHTAAEHARSIVLNDFYATLHAAGLTKFNPAAFPRGTFYPAPAQEEAIVRESPLLKAWSEHVRGDTSIGEGSAENYIRIVARYLF